MQYFDKTGEIPKFSMFENKIKNEKTKNQEQLGKTDCEVTFESKLAYIYILY